MERVGSSAMKSLAAYADSDEDSDEEYSKQSGGDGIDSDDYETQKLSSANRHRTLSNVEIANTQLPEAPDSNGEEDDGGGSEKSFKGEKIPNIDDDDEGLEVRRKILISDDDNSESHLVEPPPPARPKAFQSPSPSSSRGSTPQIAKVTKSSALPRLPSSQALVSYQGEDEEQRLSMEQADADEMKNFQSVVASENSRAAEQSRSSPGRSPHISPKSETDEIDVEELLDKPLEAAAINSPGEAVSVDSIQIPPPPSAKCPQELQDKFRQYLERKRRENFNFNDVIQNRTDFRNPSIYEKLIEHFGIDEVGTNFPNNVYDPHGFKPNEYYEEIAKAQRLLMEKGVEKDTKPKPAPTVVVAPPDEKKRKTKWDN